ncbi:DEAD/DEAH box helicase family protein [Mucilaginibacter segetis]|uniref:Uncharacterized protein n=1 Tax=Mucilaginibacter segetis TaxID=2793071 RepID=A0A934PSK8_9SPHI|nr:hypothetical protein [Mucilaginibacter segetis]MBK0380044.1 hypothetical protein [Mucilaginibacter segetis]
MNTDSLFPNLTIVNLLNDFHQNEFDVSTIDNYMVSYHAFLNYFKIIADRKGEIRKDDLIIGINFTYGWMPTIFSFKNDDFDYPLHILNQVQQGAIIGIKEFNALKSLFNNSIVGTSKLLHFINPEQYAIWDSRVCRFATGRNNVYQSQVNNTEYFNRYLNLSRLLSSEPLFEYEIYQPFCKKLNEYQQKTIPVTPLRVLELLLFLMDIKKYGRNNKVTAVVE